MNCPTKNPLQRDGTSQNQRMLEALDPSSAKIHEFQVRDWMLFAQYYARELNYYTITNDQVPQGNWTNFLKTENEIESFLNKIQEKDFTPGIEPHLALFLSFLKLMQVAQDQMNGLTKKHLDFYYKNVLQLKNNPAVEDKVVLIFELAKNVSSYKLEDDTLFDAGKDKGTPPKPLEYIINEGPVIYPAKVELLKSVFHEQNKSVRYAEVANSADGSGAALDKNNPVWYGFGFDKVPIEKDSNVFIRLPAAKLGFALASPILLLAQGQRTITVSFDLVFPSGGVDYSAFAALKNQLVILLTGEKEWVSPSTVTITKMPSAPQTQLEFVLTIDTAEKAIIGYDSKLHRENYITEAPVMRVLLETGENTGYKVWKEFTKATLNKCTIKVDVKGLKNLVLENDEGKLDPAKPFLPFGAVPKKDADFYIGSDEIFNKKWQSISLNIDWKHKPKDFAAHYAAYKTNFLKTNFTRNAYNLTPTNFTINGDNEVPNDDYFKVDASFIKNNRWSDPEEKKLFTESPIVIDNPDNVSQNPVNINYGFTQLYATGYSANKLYTQNYLLAAPLQLNFNYTAFDPGFVVTGTSTQNFTAATKNNFIRLQLKTDFFHANFPILYAAAITIPGGIIPSAPYTPTVASLTVDYKAEVSNEFAISKNTNEQKLQNYQQRAIQLFHELPFGQGEQHIFLKEQLDFVPQKTAIDIVPRYTSEGEFFIGIRNAEPESLLSILFQVAEGSENPDSPAFQKTDEIQWYFLCNNEWKFLNDDFIISDATNDFLRPGIIEFLIPKEATFNNTVLPKDLYWLKGKLPAGITFDSICKFIEVIAQAAQASFLNNNNELSHLSTALPAGTISKMLNKQSAVKSVTQPFNSFGGLPAETDEHFYIRVSERLRHKNRAVDIWDYERLVLEKFPAIYKVKCLNHTSTGFELAPGYVRIIPIPDIRNKNIYDILQPRVSKNTLVEIEDYLADLHGFFVDCKAENPGFEPVKFDFSVRFYEQYDPKGYAKILNEALKKYLSPWAYDDYSEIQFGGALYKSRVIAFIEELPYVDFISGFKMYNMTIGEINRDDITADNSRAILTSYKQHNIQIIQPPVCP